MTNKSLTISNCIKLNSNNLNNRETILAHRLNTSRQIFIFPKKKKPSPFIDPLKEKREENSPQFSASRSSPLRGGGLIPSRPDGSRVYSSSGIAYYALPSPPSKNRHAFWEETGCRTTFRTWKKGDDGGGRVDRKSWGRGGERKDAKRFGEKRLAKIQTVIARACLSGARPEYFSLLFSVSGPLFISCQPSPLARLRLPPSYSSPCCCSSSRPLPPPPFFFLFTPRVQFVLLSFFTIARGTMRASIDRNTV